VRLYHYTCSHTRPVVGTRGMLRPNPHPWLGVSVLWLTDQDAPDRRGLGLTSNMLQCDRLEFRYIVEAGDAKRWNDYAASVSLRARMILESASGARPDTWWVIDHAVLGVLDRSYSQAGLAGAQEHAIATAASEAQK
jgi:hypothetical protein